MAKSNSILLLPGTHRDITFVKSKAYGNHIRSARGTHKPAVVNEAFREASQRIQQANVPAKMLKDALEPYWENFKGGLLWQRLVSFFRAQLRTTGTIDFSLMRNFEIYEQYPLSRFLSVVCSIRYDKPSNLLHLHLDYKHHPKFRGMAYLDSYQLSVIVLFPCLETTSVETAEVCSPVISLKSTYKPFTLSLPVPSGANDFVLCLKAEGCENGVARTVAANKGICILTAGKLLGVLPIRSGKNSKG